MTRCTLTAALLLCAPLIQAQDFALEQRISSLEQALQALNSTVQNNVGIDPMRGIYESQLEAQRQRIDRLERENQELRMRLTALETRTPSREEVLERIREQCVREVSQERGADLSVC